MCQIVQQIAIGGTDKTKLAHLWTNLLGMCLLGAARCAFRYTFLIFSHFSSLCTGVPKIGTFQSEKENVDEDILQIGFGPTAVEIDIMQPLDENKSPKVHIPPLNHFGLWVDDLAKCVAHLTSQGVRFAPGGIRKGASGHDVCFIHPKGNEQTPYGYCTCLVFVLVVVVAFFCCCCCSGFLTLSYVFYGGNVSCTVEKAVSLSSFKHLKMLSRSATSRDHDTFWGVSVSIHVEESLKHAYHSLSMLHATSLQEVWGHQSQVNLRRKSCKAATLFSTSPLLREVNAPEQENVNSIDQFIHDL